MRNVMVDLETFGNGPTAVIVSIGAVEFDETGLGKEFYCKVSPESCVSHGLKMDTRTVLWWLKQSEDARRAIYEGESESLEYALVAFADYFPHQATLWGNGATFDNVILANAYRAIGHETPWSFWDDRCYRTMKNMFPQVPQPNRFGVAHKALDDAIFQAQHMAEILKHINSMKGASDANPSQQT